MSKANGAAGKDTLRATAKPIRSPVRALIVFGFAIPVIYFVWLVSYTPASTSSRSVTARGGDVTRPRPVLVPGGKDAAEATPSTVARSRFWGQEDRDAAIEARAQEIVAKDLGGYYIMPWEQVPPWPWQKIKDHRWMELGIMAFCAPFEDNFFTRTQMKGLFNEFRTAGLLVLGISSYEDFPKEITNPADSRHVGTDMPEIIAGVDGWLHCFRDPVAIDLPPGVPRALISESDFVQTERNDGGGRLTPLVPRPPLRFHAAYVNRGGAWNDFNRNWTVAEPSMIRLVDELDFFIATIDREPSHTALSQLPPEKRQNIQKQPSMPWKRYLELVEATSMVFLPNVHDASPRVITEAMSLGTPVLMNRNILGGWKYLEESGGKAGEFFEDERDVVEAAKRLMARMERGEVDPRGAVKAKWGQVPSAARLRAFMEDVVGMERLARVREIAVKHQIRPQRHRSLHHLASTVGIPHFEDPGHPDALHHTPADLASLDMGPIVVGHVRGLKEAWPEGEAPEVITPLGQEIRFDGLRRWLREEGRDAPAELRAMIEDTILGFGVGL